MLRDRGKTRNALEPGRAEVRGFVPGHQKPHEKPRRDLGRAGVSKCHSAAAG